MYEVRIARRAVKDTAGLPKAYAHSIAQHIDGLRDNARPPDAKQLRGGEGYSLRVGMYRVLYDIDEAQVITSYRVKHRREAYR